MNYSKLIELYNNYMQGNKTTSIEEIFIDLFKKYDGKIKFIGLHVSRPSWNDGDEINTYVEIYEDLETFDDDQCFELNEYDDDYIEPYLPCGYERVYTLDSDHPDFDEDDYDDKFIEVNEVELEQFDRNVIEFYFENFAEVNINYFITYDPLNEKVTVFTEEFDSD